jgi:hypothetical protein
MKMCTNDISVCIIVRVGDMNLWSSNEMEGGCPVAWLAAWLWDFFVSNGGIIENHLE